MVDMDGSAGVFGDRLLSIETSGSDSPGWTIESVDFAEVDNLHVDDVYLVDVSHDLSSIGTDRLSTVAQNEAWALREPAVSKELPRDGGYFLVLVASPVTQGEPATAADLRVMLRGTLGAEMSLRARKYAIGVLVNQAQCEDFFATTSRSW